MKKRFLIGTILLISLLIFSTISTATIGIQPLTIHLTPKRGETVPFEFNILSKEKTPELIKLSLCGQTQLLSGDLTFGQDSKEVPEIQWVKLDKTETLLPAGESVKIKGTIKVPFDAKGSHTVAVMVDPQKEEKSGSVILNVLYAIRLDIQVDAPGVSPAARINEFEMVKGEKGEPVIYTIVENTSLLDYSTTAVAVLRDMKTKRLIEKVELRPETAWANNKTEMRMFAGSTLKYYGSPKQAILPGEYDLRLFYRFASAGQILQNKNIQIKQGDYVYPAAKLRIVQVSPEDVRLEGRPGSMAMKGLKFTNKSNTPVHVSIEPVDIELGYPNSIIENTRLEFNPGQKFTLEAGRISVVVIKVNYPKDAVTQGNYGLLKVKVTSTEPSQAVLEQFTVNLEAVVSGKPTQEAEATNISGARDGSKYLLSAIIKNTGNIKLTPSAEVTLKDKDGKLVTGAKLMAEGDNTASVIPGKLITLTGVVNDLKPGLYKAEIKIYQDSTEIGNTFLDLKVK